MLAVDDGVIETLLDKVVALCLQAGEAVMEVYCSAQPLHIESKADASPVTKADRLAHQIIIAGLKQLMPGWPILSEEQVAPNYAIRRQWHRYWLVDPLDGTREFIDRTGEFTVNIALIDRGVPVLGVVGIPCEQVAYMSIAGNNSGAWRQDKRARNSIKVRQLTLADKVKVLSSGRDKGPELKACIAHMQQQFAGVEWLRAGSALKFCHLAQGSADIYPRFSPCCEWDTAAGQAILQAAGGQLLDVEFRPIRYNQKASLINPCFYGLGAADFDWQVLLQPQGGGEGT
jgi:3'(2'), 5'-bisphosphate nucleotidase